MTKKLKPPKYIKQTARLPKNHNWRAPDGYKIVVIDRGAASFNVPQAWIIHKFEPFEMHDAPEPDNKSRLMATIWHMPPGVDWEGLPIEGLLKDSTKGSKFEDSVQGPITRMPRTDIEQVWLANEFTDPEEKRPAISHIMIARGFDVIILITFDFWAEKRDELRPMWNELLNSLLLGRKIEDPLKGETLH